jgi:hypothetical protein
MKFFHSTNSTAMLTLFSLITMLSCVSAVKGTSKTLSKEESNQSIRRLQSTYPPYIEPIFESKPCVEFSQITEEQWTNARTDESCQTNSCGDGCCRDFPGFVICDTANTFMQIPCVCNALTKDPNSFTPDTALDVNVPPYPSYNNNIGNRKGPNSGPGKMRRRLGGSYNLKKGYIMG